MAEILVVDDAASTREALEMLLRTAGYSVRTAASGHEALAAVDVRLPDVVVTDLVMPGMDGLELAGQLQERRVDLPVILLTGIDEVDTAVSAMRMGVTDYLAKPIDAELLSHAVDRALQRRDQLREAADFQRRNAAILVEFEQNLRAREELLSVVAHDLRGPLATLLLATSSEAGIQERREMIRRAARRMGRLVEELLDAARVEMGTFVIEPAFHRASTLLDDIASTVGPEAIERSIRLVTTLQNDFTLECDFERLVQAIVNLASNAVAYSPAGARVLVAAERRGDRAFFAVTDEGPGIAQEDIAHVFDRGWHKSRGGSGLGLTIAKGIVEAHHGTIGVDSRPAAGTTFSIDVPCTASTQAAWVLSSGP